ncbi:MAG: class I SAM-dependent RNA methyltransferase [Spirochaetales bacterium]|nr:class I SAM-dependent RNA methyltransferase [Spirochaetales bacterium]
MDGIGRTLRLTIDRIVPGGDGLGHHDGKAVFVPGSAPGDELEVRVVDTKPGYERGEIVGIVSPGLDRVEPVCPYYGDCGGCNLMHLSYPGQLEAKRGIVLDAWRRAGGLGDVDLDVVSSRPLGYRNRAQFHFDAEHRVCYARRSSNSMLPITSCPVLTPALQQWLAGDGRDAAWSTLSQYTAGKDRFMAFGYHDDAWLEGPDGELSVAVGGKNFRFHIRGFFQSNLETLERLVPAVVGDAVTGEEAADLYCGVGLFGAFLGDSFGRVTCVEQDQRSIGYASLNVGAGARYAASSIEDWTKTTQASERYDYVVVDPPRAGLAPRVRAWLVRALPPVIGYVSCDPVSLARDAGTLVQAGYEVEKASVFDFYPQTSHVESYVRFRLR